MKTLNELECEAVSGGIFPVWGAWAGTALAELREHPEAGVMGPVWGPIYLATRH
jgi:hypothetical protein